MEKAAVKRDLPLPSFLRFIFLWMSKIIEISTLQNT